MSGIRNDRGETEPGVVLSVVGALLALVFIHGAVSEPIPDPPAQFIVNSQSNGSGQVTKGDSGGVVLSR